MGKNTFVFVVCGEEKHIHTLNFSLRYLRHFSENDILVVTDVERNQADIIHDEIINVETPRDYNDHQASIYLKTSLHKILNLDREYCYLDSDVISTNQNIDEVFNHKSGPVTFASDHCSLPEFSPMAMQCGCKEKAKKKVEQFNKLDLEFKDKFIPKDPIILKGRLEILKVMDAYDDQFQGYRRNPLVRFFLYHLKPSKYDFERYLKERGNFRWDDSLKRAYDEHDNLVYDEYNNPITQDYVEARTSFRWNSEKELWYDQDGTQVFKATCGHLMDEITQKFKVKISSSDWTHWNGGVFLFNKESIPFMDAWHDKTMIIFQDKNWETRDQGTLAATTWEFNLQDQPRLPTQFNFLADYNISELQFRKGGLFSTDNFHTTIQPKFLHIYHHFGDKKWDVWTYVEGLLPQEDEQTLQAKTTVANVK